MTTPEAGCLLRIIEALASERMVQIRRAHASARPKTVNPAWVNCHHDMAFMFNSIDAALSEARCLAGHGEATPVAPSDTEMLDWAQANNVAWVGPGMWHSRNWMDRKWVDAPDLRSAIRSAMSASPPTEKAALLPTETME